MRHLPRLLIASILIIITTAVVAKADTQTTCSFYDQTGVYQGRLDLNVGNILVRHRNYPLKCMHGLNGVSDYINEVVATVTFQFRKEIFMFYRFSAYRGCSTFQINQSTPVEGVMENFDEAERMLVHIQAAWKGNLLTQFSPERITIGRDTEYTVRDCHTH